jgi:chemosensory pili system protein ChpA (sensor histidine kinase/response regulator)
MGSPTVLVAEDDRSVRMTIQFVLEDEGFDVHMAENGIEALRKAQDLLPDVILLDQIMPKMDGKEVLAELRAEESTRHIPVVVLTGMSRGSADDWPGAHFVGKPFAPEELVGQIRALVGDRRT